MGQRVLPHFGEFSVLVLITFFTKNDILGLSHVNLAVS